MRTLGSSPINPVSANLFVMVADERLHIIEGLAVPEAQGAWLWEDGNRILLEDGTGVWLLEG